MTRHRELALLSTQAQIGGGEVMLLSMAQIAARAGAAVRVVVPDGETAAAADRLGVRVDLVRARSRRDHVLQLGRWATNRHQDTLLLWCNGLFPAVATLGHRHRIVHLHQVPQSKTQQALLAAARRWSEAVYVPSLHVGRLVPASTVLSNWTDELSRTRGDLGQPPLRVGFVGRPSPFKGFVTLCSALTTLIEQSAGAFELVVAGEPKFISAADKAVIESAIAPIARSVTRLGWVDRDDFFAAVDLVVVPSLVPESFGLVAAEAMGAGRPVIVSDAGALPEVVGPAHPWVVPAGDAAALADMIRTVCDSDPAPVVAAARRRWEQEFSPVAGARRFQRILAKHAVIDAQEDDRA